MTGVIRKATILVALGLVAASAAMAGIPDAAHCTVPTYIKVVGTNAGTPDTRGTFTITVRDIGNIPVSGSVVTLNFNACSDMKLCNGVSGASCAPSFVTATTNASGVATFTVVGGGLAGSVAGLSTACVEIRASGYLLGNAYANVYDLNGAVAGAGKNGVLISDMPLWSIDWAGGSGSYKARADYNQNGAVGINDLPIWAVLWGANGSVSGCSATYCP